MTTLRKHSLCISLMGFLLVCMVQELQTEEVNLALSTRSIFCCTRAAFTLIWIVNGVRIEFAGINGIVLGEEEHLGGGLLRRNLTVTAREEHDGLDLQCSASSLQNNVMIVVVLEVHLRIQGLLSSPGNVHTVNDSSSLLLSWTAPFTLDITDVDPDISHYTVYITNLITGRMGEENVTETEFIFTGLQEEGAPDPCSTYQFTVSAWNVVGEGNRSEPVYGKLTNDIEINAGSTTTTPELTQADQITVGEPTITAITATATAALIPQVEQPSVTPVPTVGSSASVRLNPSQSAAGPVQYQEIAIIFIATGAGVACTLIALLLMLTCTVAFCCVRKKSHKVNSHDIDVKANQAYEVTVIGRRSAPVEPCPAYGIVGSHQ